MTGILCKPGRLMALACFTFSALNTAQVLATPVTYTGSTLVATHTISDATGTPGNLTLGTAHFNVNRPVPFPSLTLSNQVDGNPASIGTVSSFFTHTAGAATDQFHFGGDIDARHLGTPPAARFSEIKLSNSITFTLDVTGTVNLDVSAKVLADFDGASDADFDMWVRQVSTISLFNGGFGTSKHVGSFSFLTSDLFTQSDFQSLSVQGNAGDVFTLTISSLTEAKSSAARDTRAFFSSSIPDGGLMIDLSVEEQVAVAEPGLLSLFVAGLAGLGYARRKRAA